MTDTTTDKEEITRPLFYKKELIVISQVIVLLSVIFCLFSLLNNQAENIKTIAKINIDISLLPFSAVFSILGGVILTASGLLLNLYDGDKPIIKSVKNWVIYSILFILGVAAYFIIVIGLDTFNCPFWASTLVASLIYLCYLYLMLKMYFYNYIQDKRIFFEIIRFALVGVIASLFDLSTCYLFQFVILPSTLAPIWLTIISVTMGFVVGVTVNYLCSIYMVFKSTTSKDKSRTTTGKILFLSFAVVGLLMGYGLQYLFYDVWGVGYVLTFIIRTLIVLVWNYLSRKYFIFK